MSLKTRGILVLVIGTILGVSLSVGGTLLEARKQGIGQYLADIRDDLITVANNEMTREAMNAFAASKSEFGSQLAGRLQSLYITENPHPTGEKHKLDRADDPSIYSDLHGRFHPWFRDFLERRIDLLDRIRSHHRPNLQDCDIVSNLDRRGLETDAIAVEECEHLLGRLVRAAQLKM